MAILADAPPRAYGLYGWIQSNNSRSLQFFGGFALAVQLLAIVLLCVPLAFLDEAHSPLFGPVGYLTRYVPLILVGSLGLFGAQLFWHMETVKKRAGFRYVDDADEPRLCGLLEPLIVEMRVPVPFVAVIESNARNAFACGISRRHAVVVVTRGLLASLNDAELRAVLAHELTHVANGDIRLMAAANICMSNLEELDRANILQFRHWLQFLWCLAFPVFFPLMLVGSLVGRLAMRTARRARYAITSSREFIADAEAAQITRNPAALASALVRIRDRGRIDGLAPKDDAMMISGAEHGDDATHPQIQRRLDALARVTGPMMFNAPGAPALADLGDAPRRAVFGRALRDAEPEVTADRWEWLGLDRTARWGLGGAFAVFLAMNVTNLTNPAAIAAKFDIRTFGTLIGVYQKPCVISAAQRSCAATAQEKNRARAAQRGTLVGTVIDARGVIYDPAPEPGAAPQPAPDGRN
jgi:Zn-dependent protease with chaperone function